MSAKITPNIFIMIAAWGIFVFVFSDQQVMAIPFGDANTLDGNFDGAICIHAADLDHDGDLDVLGAAHIDDDIAWWENDGSPADGGWTKHDITTSFGEAVSVHAADLDHDGDLDVLGAAFADYDITWWENDGSPADGGWSQHTIDGAFGTARDVYAADLDNDGDLDVVGAAAEDRLITWWENDGSPNDGGWTKRDISTNFNGAICVYAADLDHDGDMDVLGAATTDYDLTWWENDGSPADGGWTEHTIHDNFKANYVRTADLDDDGDLDVIGAASTDGNMNLAWWENDGSPADGGWTNHAIDTDESDRILCVIVADLDNDGDQDLLEANFDTDSIIWWENDGSPTNGGWIEHTINGTFLGAYSVYAADLDDDGDLDVLGAASDADDITWWENITIQGDLDKNGKVNFFDFAIFANNWLVSIE